MTITTTITRQASLRRAPSNSKSALSNSHPHSAPTRLQTLSSESTYSTSWTESKSPSPSTEEWKKLPDPTMTLEGKITSLAALPSLSKSLNHLPALVSLRDETQINGCLYEGMPSQAQGKSHEKLRLAITMTTPDSKEWSDLISEKAGMYHKWNYSNLAMTPTETRQQSMTRAKTHAPKKSKFHLCSEDMDDDYTL
ncbi:hypothetical protein FRC03_005241 [Tulasnella sp. 419]|nr:hypothetical protein FRC02_006342 [Tulasnella sp. 418]KAG8968975.1 hypothetical protein FRC03_005241 [Tulasnella sp. 419]